MITKGNAWLQGGKCWGKIGEGVGGENERGGCGLKPHTPRFSKSTLLHMIDSSKVAGDCQASLTKVLDRAALIFQFPHQFTEVFAPLSKVLIGIIRSPPWAE